MASQKLKPATIGEYIKSAPFVLQERLYQLHECIRGAAPDAAESLKWNMPAYSYQKILVTFAVHKKHTGFYPMPSAMDAFAKQLEKYHTAKGSVQFPHDQPLPLALIKKIVQYRVKESINGNIKWYS